MYTKKNRNITGNRKARSTFSSQCVTNDQNVMGLIFFENYLVVVPPSFMTKLTNCSSAINPVVFFSTKITLNSKKKGRKT